MIGPIDRRHFGKSLLGILGASVAVTRTGAAEPCPSEVTQQATPVHLNKVFADKMYAAALAISKKKIRGGESEIAFKKPFLDAAFSDNIFLWDSCFLCCFAKYHLGELPAHQALDNFYGQMEDDGFICREYFKDGRPVWPKTHPVSINPPLLSFAERELFSVTRNLGRLKTVYPLLRKNFYFHIDRFMDDDGLFSGDGLGSGMDNLPRYPPGWVAHRGSGLTHEKVVAKVNDMHAPGDAWVEAFVQEYMISRQGVWYEKSRLVDLSSQMAMYARDLAEIAKLVGEEHHRDGYLELHARISDAINARCWDEKTQFYYDLGEGRQISRKHIGMYWALLGGVVPRQRLPGFLSHLVDPDRFYRKTPLCALSADDPDYVGWGDYWLGGVWPPTVYMVLKGLSAYQEDELARHLAARVYASVAAVYTATGTFWENYAPDLVSYGMPSKKDFCGWTALIPISVYREYLS